MVSVLEFFVNSLMIFTKCVSVIVGRCPYIANPEHGRVTFDHDPLVPFIARTIATYSCDLGYGLEGGDLVRTCEMDGFSPDGAWSGKAPTCIGQLSKFEHIELP